MEQLTINIPSEYEFDSVDKRKIILKKKESKLPKTWGELGTVSGYYMDAELAKADRALIKLIQLREKYRDGWKPDWGGGNGRKAIMYLWENEWTQDITRGVNEIFAFQSVEIRDEFYNNFKDNLLEEIKPLFQ